MKKITSKSVNAFMNDRNYRNGNTIVNNNGRETRMSVFGNTIAIKNENGIHINNCGYETVTTKERLNGILYYANKPRISQVKYRWYMGDISFPSNVFVTI